MHTSRARQGPFRRHRIEGRPISSTGHSHPATTFVPVILAGGSGTRFWPRSRRARAKQVLSLHGDRTMIQQTVDRLGALAHTADVWVVTNDCLASTIEEQLPGLSDGHLLCEPAARNTAPACGLAAFLLERSAPETVLGVFPSDHVVGDTARFVGVLREGIALATQPGTIVVLGVPPSRPETGYGYIEAGDALGAASFAAIPAHRVRRFTEKPDLHTAESFLHAGNYSWNSGIFLWSARTLADALREHAPELATRLQIIADSHGTPAFEDTFETIYPSCENISIDYAVLEPRSQKGEAAANIVCLPADFGWNDLGSWSALHEHSLSIAAPGSDSHGNVAEGSDTMAIDARGNYVYAPGRHIAMVGVEDVVVVVTDDAVLVTTRHRSQDVSAVVKTLREKGQLQLT